MRIHPLRATQSIMPTPKPILEATFRLQTLLDALPDAVVLVDRGGAIMASNEAWRELLKESSSGSVPRPEGGLWLDHLTATFAGATKDHDAVAEGLRAVA